jgi:hypothetical protein
MGRLGKWSFSFNIALFFYFAVHSTDHRFMYRTGDCNLISTEYKFDSVEPHSANLAPGVCPLSTSDSNHWILGINLAIELVLPKAQDPTTLTTLGVSNATEWKSVHITSGSLCLPGNWMCRSRDMPRLFEQSKNPICSGIAYLQY